MSTNCKDKIKLQIGNDQKHEKNCNNVKNPSNSKSNLKYFKIQNLINWNWIDIKQNEINNLEAHQ